MCGRPVVITQNAKTVPFLLVIKGRLRVREINPDEKEEQPAPPGHFLFTQEEKL